MTYKPNWFIITSEQKKDIVAAIEETAYLTVEISETVRLFYLQNIEFRRKNMFCKKCGNQIQQGSRFCMNCGNAVENQESTADNNVPFASVSESNAVPSSLPTQSGNVSKTNNKLSNKAKYGIVAGVIALIALCVLVVTVIIPSVSKSDPDIIGKWYRDGYHDEYICFTDNGTFLIGVIDGDGIIGTYHADGKQLTMTFDDQSIDDENYTLVSNYDISDNILTINAYGNTEKYVKAE